MSFDPRLLQALRALRPDTDPGEFYLERGWDLPNRLVPLLLEGSPFRGLLYGATGVGKSTEFSRWARALSDVANVILVTVQAASTLWESIGRSLTSETSSQINHPRLTPALNTLLGVSTGVTLPPEAVTENRKQRVVEVLRGLPKGTGGRPVLLLIDGLELLPNAADLFRPGGALMDPDLPSLIATAPYSMPLLHGSDIAPAFLDKWHLQPFPVLSQTTDATQGRQAQPSAATVRRFAEHLRQRTGSAGELFDHPDFFDRIALMSGGVPRHAMLLLRGALLSAISQPRVTLSDVLRAERDLRQDLLASLREGDDEVMRSVEETGRFFGGEHLLRGSVVYAIEGERQREWTVHPLLITRWAEGAAP
jgi:hypothetical protein